MNFRQVTSSCAAHYDRGQSESIYGLVDATDTMKILGTYDLFKRKGRSVRLFVRTMTDSGSYGCKSRLAIEEVSKKNLFFKKLAQKCKRGRVDFPSSYYVGVPFSPVVHLEKVLKNISHIKNRELVDGALKGIETLRVSLDKKPKKWSEYSLRLSDLSNHIRRQMAFSSKEAS